MTITWCFNPYFDLWQKNWCTFKPLYTYSPKCHLLHLLVTCICYMFSFSTSVYWWETIWPQYVFFMYFFATPFKHDKDQECFTLHCLDSLLLSNGFFRDVYATMFIVDDNRRQILSESQRHLSYLLCNHDQWQLKIQKSSTHHHISSAFAWRNLCFTEESHEVRVCTTCHKETNWSISWLPWVVDWVTTSCKTCGFSMPT